MADQQPGNGSAEPLSYDADLDADVRGAMTEVSEAPEAPEPSTDRQQPTTPSEPKADHPTDERRYSDGTFKPTKEDVAQQGANEQHAKATQEQQPQQPQPTEPQAGMPPNGWSVASKAAWEKLPDHIRADVLKREQEVSQGFAQYQDVAELRDFVLLARSQGVAPREVVERYINAEQHLRQDFIGGMTAIAGAMGISPAQIAQAFAPYLGQSNGQSTQGYQQPYDDTQASQQPAFDPAYLQQWINPLAQKIHHLESNWQQQQQAERHRQEAAINSVLERFAADPRHRYFANVQDEVVEALQSSKFKRTGDYMADLEAAYKKAIWNNEEIRPLLINEQNERLQAVKQQQQKEAAEKARHASRSITGSPSTGAPRDFGDDDNSVEADAKRAYYAHRV